MTEKQWAVLRQKYQSQQVYRDLFTNSFGFKKLPGSRVRFEMGKWIPSIRRNVRINLMRPFLVCVSIYNLVMLAWFFLGQGGFMKQRGFRISKSCFVEPSPPKKLVAWGSLRVASWSLSSPLPTRRKTGFRKMTRKTLTILRGPLDLQCWCVSFFHLLRNLTSRTLPPLKWGDYNSATLS